MSSASIVEYGMPAAGQIWPSPITAQASADFERALAGDDDEANEVLFSYVVATEHRAATVAA